MALLSRNCRLIRCGYCRIERNFLTGGSAVFRKELSIQSNKRQIAQRNGREKAYHEGDGTHNIHAQDHEPEEENLPLHALRKDTASFHCLNGSEPFINNENGRKAEAKSGVDAGNDEENETDHRDKGDKDTASEISPEKAVIGKQLGEAHMLAIEDMEIEFDVSDVDDDRNDDAQEKERNRPADDVAIMVENPAETREKEIHERRHNEKAEMFLSKCPALPEKLLD